MDKEYACMKIVKITRVAMSRFFMLFIALTTTSASAEVLREVKSLRVAAAPVIDGALTEAAWKQAAVTESMIQSFPDPGKPASFPTEVRILHDDQAIYVGALCRDPEPAGIVSRVTRRDRWIESDWFQVDIDSRHDRRSGFFFAVNAAGVQLDGTWHDDDQQSTDWDGVWEARTRVVAAGWEVEMRIPLKLLRYTAGEQVRFGINFTRRISRLNESNQWQYIPPESGMWVSLFGELNNMDLSRQPLRYDVAPYVATRSGWAQAGSEPRPFDLGVDARLGLSSNFMLTLTANPDFGQVEVDQVVLNLSTIETYYPEKRPFFLEDRQLFQTPRFGDGGSRAELFYTRRIGRAPRSPDTQGDEEITQDAQLPRIWGAAKLAGRTDSRLSVGLLQAVTSEQSATLRGADDAEFSRVAEPLTSFSILRLKQEFSRNSSVGLMTTAMATKAHGSAVTGGTDLQLELFDGKYNFTALTYFSYLTDERHARHDDFTRAALERDGPLGYGGKLLFRKKSGEHLVGALGAEYRSPTLALNDMGYLDRQDLFMSFIWLQYRHFKPLGPFARISVNFNGWMYRNTELMNVSDGSNINGWAMLKNNWRVGFWVNTNPSSRCDDRETRSAGAVDFCTDTPHFGGGVSLQTDQRKFISAGLQSNVSTTERGQGLYVKLPVTINPAARLQLEVIPGYQRDTGGLRWIDTQATARGDRYLFAERHREFWDVTFRSTFTFTTELTLQAYAQVFLAAVDYGRKYENTPTGSRIHVNNLQDAPTVADDYDFTDSVLNLSVVLRWEYLPGSVAYLVYTGTFGESSDRSDFRFGGGLNDIFLAPAEHVLLLKVSYFWG
jgi:hypothetical protein